VKVKSVIALCVLLIATFTASAQSPRRDTYQIGRVSIVVPAPEGFENVLGTIPNDHGRFATNENTGLLAIQVPSDIVEKLHSTPLMPLEIYTRTVVSPQVRDTLVSRELFAQVAAQFKNSFEDLYDTKGKVMTSAKRSVTLWTSQVRGKVTSVDISKPKNLGSFNESDDTLSTLMLLVLDIEGIKVPMLVSMSILRVNDRLVNVSVYRRDPAEKDVDSLTRLTQTWTAAIMAANK
jgi:hypothetical protein